MMRPDQPLFDHFSLHFERIDSRLEQFCKENGWELRKNPLRKPGREVRFRDKADFLLSIDLEGYWLNLDPDASFLHSIACSTMYKPVSDMYFFKRQMLAEHKQFDFVEENLEIFFQNALKFAKECKLPTLTCEGFYFVPEGWCVGTSGSLMQMSELQASGKLPDEKFE